MTFDNTLPHQLPWNYPWIKDEIERRDEYIAQLEAELAHQKPQNHDSGAIEGEHDKVPAEDEIEAHREPDSRDKLEADVRRSLGFTVDDVFHWLDRQEAITEEKTRYKWVTASAEEIAAWRSRAEKLKQQVYEMTAERDKWRTKSEENSHGWAKANTGWAEANAEAEKWRMKCDEYREKFGRAIDCADEIRRLS